MIQPDAAYRKKLLEEVEKIPTDPVKELLAKPL